MKNLALLFFVFVLSPAAFAETVYKVAVKSVSGNRLILRFTAEAALYTPGEGLCIYRNRKTVACGAVISSDSNSVEVRIMKGTSQFNADERLLVRGNDKFNLAANKNDVSAGGNKGGKPPIKQKLNVSTGIVIFAPATYFKIPLTIEYAVASKTTMGIEPFYATSGSALTIIGASLFMHYYFKERYRRLYFFTGVGLYAVTGKAKDATGIEITEKINAISVKFGLGNRWVFGNSFNMTLQGGGLYLTKTAGAQLDFGFNQFSAMVGLQFGLLL